MDQRLILSHAWTHCSFGGDKVNDIEVRTSKNSADVEWKSFIQALWYFCLINQQNSSEKPLYIYIYIYFGYVCGEIS